MKKLIFIVLILAIGLLGVGVYQNYLNNPIRGCHQFETDTNYNGYHCANDDVFIQQ